jgi:hypothetical protein
MAWGNALLELLYFRPKRKKQTNKAIDALLGQMPEGPNQPGNIADRTNAIRQKSPKEAYQYLLNEISPETRQARESKRLSNQQDQIAVQEAKRQQGLYERLSGLVQGGAGNIESGQKEINNTLMQLVPGAMPSYMASSREKPVGGLWRGDDGYMYGTKYNPQSGEYESVRVGDQKADPRYSYGEYAGGLYRTSPTDEAPTQVMTPEEMGEGKGTATMNADEITRRYEDRMKLFDNDTANSLRLIDDAMNHPGFDSAYGFQNVIPSTWMDIPGTDEAGFLGYLDQQGGQAFMQAYEKLKGGGQITENETKQATDALTRIRNRKQSDEDARKAWAEFRDAIERGLEKLRAKSQMDFTTEVVGGGMTYDEFKNKARFVE